VGTQKGHSLPAGRQADLIWSSHSPTVSWRGLWDRMPEHSVSRPYVGSDRIWPSRNRLKVDLIIMGLRRSTHIEAASHVPWATAYEVVCRAGCPVVTARRQGLTFRNRAVGARTNSDCQPLLFAVATGIRLPQSLKCLQTHSHGWARRPLPPAVRTANRPGGIASRKCRSGLQWRPDASLAEGRPARTTTDSSQRPFSVNLRPVCPGTKAGNAFVQMLGRWSDCRPQASDPISAYRDL